MQAFLPSGDSGSPRSRQILSVFAYLGMLLLGVVGFWLIRLVGEGLNPGTEAAVSAVLTETTAVTTGGTRVDVIYHVLITLAAMISLGYVLGRLLQMLGQPPVIGEVIAGICLGPSLLGAISPELMHQLIPAASTDPQGLVSNALKTVAQLGIVLYMFAIGLELNANHVKHKIHAAVAISHVSIIMPFLLGALLAIWLFPHYAPEGIDFTSFSLFLGVAMAITAFPVLARILTDRGMDSTPLGALAMACAAADDATAWCLLALVVGIVQTEVSQAVRVGIASLLFIIAMFLIAQPLMRRWCAYSDRHSPELSQAALVFGLVGVLLAAVTTEVIGIHAIFGAFLMGAIIPAESRLAHELKNRLKHSVTILLLPAFFAYTGMRTEIGLISGWENWLVCLAIIGVATLGKFGGTLLAARFSGLRWRESAALGALMNTRGLMELIVLNIGLDLGVISPTLFAMMVIMALVTTLLTAPLLTLFANSIPPQKIPADPPAAT